MIGLKLVTCEFVCRWTSSRVWSSDGVWRGEQGTALRPARAATATIHYMTLAYRAYAVVTLVNQDKHRAPFTTIMRMQSLVFRHLEDFKNYLIKITIQSIFKHQKYTLMREQLVVTEVHLLKKSRGSRLEYKIFWHHRVFWLNSKQLVWILMTEN